MRLQELQDLRSVAREVVGIDVDAAAAANPTIDRFGLIQSDIWPIADASVDVCFADWVLEHVERPEAFFGEAARVLKPGGVFCARTPNRYGYFALAARAIPNRWHAKVLSRVMPERQEQDVFPTRYWCNTGRRLKRILGASGFDSIAIDYPDVAPVYLRFSRLLYTLGVAYGRWAPVWTRGYILVSARRRVPAQVDRAAATGG